MRKQQLLMLSSYRMMNGNSWCWVVSLFYTYPEVTVTIVDTSAFKHTKTSVTRKFDRLNRL